MRALVADIRKVEHRVLRDLSLDREIPGLHVADLVVRIEVSRRTDQRNRCLVQVRNRWRRNAGRERVLRTRYIYRRRRHRLQADERVVIVERAARGAELVREVRDAVAAANRGLAARRISKTKPR